METVFFCFSSKSVLPCLKHVQVYAKMAPRTTQFRSFSEILIKSSVFRQGRKNDHIGLRGCSYTVVFFLYHTFVINEFYSIIIASPIATVKKLNRTFVIRDRLYDTLDFACSQSFCPWLFFRSQSGYAGRRKSSLVFRLGMPSASAP